MVCVEKTNPRTSLFWFYSFCFLETKVSVFDNRLCAPEEGEAFVMVYLWTLLIDGDK